MKVDILQMEEFSRALENKCDKSGIEDLRQDHLQRVKMSDLDITIAKLQKLMS